MPAATWGDAAVTWAAALRTWDGTVVAPAFPALIVEAAFGANPANVDFVFDDTSRGKFDTGTFAAATTWIDLSSRLQKVSTFRGKKRLARQSEPGKATFVFDNLDQALTPSNLSGPYVTAGVTQVQPERRIRIRATVGGTTHAVWYGYIDSITPVFGTPSGSTCIIQATGPFKIGNGTPLAASAATGTSDSIGTRLGRLLDLIGVPSSDRDFDTGNSTLQATTLAQRILTEMYLSVDSEAGDLIEGADGKWVFRDRHDRYENARCNTVQATFGDSPGSAELLYDAIDIPAFDDLLVDNTISGARAGGVAQTALDATSQGRYWPKTFERHDLILESDLEVANWVADYLYKHKDAEQRIDGITLAGVASDATLWPYMLGTQLRDLIRVIRRPTGGDALDKKLFVEGIGHEIDARDQSWKTTFSTSSAAQFVNSLIFDSATLGKFGTNVFASW